MSYPSSHIFMEVEIGPIVGKLVLEVPFSTSMISGRKSTSFSWTTSSRFVLTWNLETKVSIYVQVMHSEMRINSFLLQSSVSLSRNNVFFKHVLHSRKD